MGTIAKVRCLLCGHVVKTVNFTRKHKIQAFFVHFLGKIKGTGKGKDTGKGSSKGKIVWEEKPITGDWKKFFINRLLYLLNQLGWTPETKIKTQVKYVYVNGQSQPIKAYSKPVKSYHKPLVSYSKPLVSYRRGYKGDKHGKKEKRNRRRYRKNGR